MPYKDERKQKEAVRKFMKTYRTPYMREYRKFRRKQKKELEEAINIGDLNMAKEIMAKKPHINIWTEKRKK